MKKNRFISSFAVFSLYICACTQSLQSLQLFATLWTVACQTPLSMGFSRQEDWSRLPCPPPEDFPNRVIEPASPESQLDSLPTAEPLKNPLCGTVIILSSLSLGEIF
ncbi:unnamed protein product [Rangifer tarandus platyrhynchus]|uniref:Uncharacterized protein n=1 Tax=Rangifer tarandus platyrhynchus TaxID=3082113 RepID=A0AC59YS78_RANTA